MREQGEMMVENGLGKVEEQRRRVFFPLRKLVKGLVEKIKNLKPALCV